jgi:hypothetical protein
MSNVQEEKVEQSSLPTPTSFRGRGRGRRGSRGRAPTARVRGSPPVVPETHPRVPTFQERYLEVKALEGAPHPPEAKPAPSIKELSAMMDQYYPTSLSYVDPPQTCSLDPKGYVDLSVATYNQIVARKSNLSNVCSCLEFVMCTSWLLVKRVLRIDQMLFFKHIPEAENVFRSMPDAVEIPAPLAIALESIGVIRLPTGQTIAPELVLPRIDPQNLAHTGFLPSTYQAGYQGMENLDLMQYMLPFGLWKRSFQNQVLGNQPNHGFAFARLDPQNARPEDGYLAFPALLPSYHDLPLLGPRAQTAGNVQFGVDGAFSRAICWSPQIYTAFTQFCALASKVMTMSPLPSSTAGTAAMAGVALPQNGDAHNRATKYSYLSGFTMDKNEQHAARLLRWRTRALRAENQIVRDGLALDGDLLFARSPGSMQQGTMTLPDIDSHPTYLSLFSGAFMVG